jgi:parallel beta-helix repeat protein
MKTRVIFILSLLVTSFGWMAPVLADAATYHVAKTGSNNYTCTQAQSAYMPRLTINSGINCLSAGDTLIIHAGTYDEGINDTIPAGTSTGRRTTIRANNGDTVMIRPSRGVGPSSLHGVYITRSYVAFDGLVIDGVNVELPFRINGTATGNLLQNSEVKSVHKSSGGNCITIQGQVTNSSVINNKIHGCGNPKSAGQEHGIYLWNSGHLVEHNEIYNNTSHGVHVYHKGSTTVSDNIVRYNYVHHNGTRGILIGSGDNNIAHHNIVNHNGTDGIHVGFNTSNNNQVYNNTIYSNANECIEIKSGSSSTKIKNNICLSNGKNKILDNGRGSILANNSLTTDLTLVIDAKNNRLDPRAGSPLIDAGDIISGFSIGKFFGKAPDLGAMEFVANNPVTKPAPPPTQTVTITVPSAPKSLQVVP